MSPPTAAARVPAVLAALHGSDLRGMARLGVDAVVGIADLVEAMHHTIASRPGIVGAAPAGRTRGITGFVYGAVRGSTRLVGRGLDAALRAVAPWDPERASAPSRETLLAVLNGVWGDHLAATGNPLAIAMTMRVDGVPLALDRAALARRLPQATGRLVVLAHGLCMNDLQWARRGHDHGQALARDLDATPVYLHYNSGRHVSDNGREFADLLDRLVANWPRPVRELLIVSHSMGGLVTRSACHAATHAPGAWLPKLKKLVFLGTPHHGAPLERGGHQLDRLLGVSPYAAPLARLGMARSAGITDLRFGNVQAADCSGRDERAPTPLPERVATYLVAATRDASQAGLRSRLLGDGLVPVASALGAHRDPAHTLDVPRTHRYVATEADHWDLLNRADVYARLRTWLA